MKIGIIIYSHSGNTRDVADSIARKFADKGLAAQIEQITIEEEIFSRSGQVVLQIKPDLAKYDGIILGTPVRGGKISPMMSAYLRYNSDIRGKKTACYVTHFFPLQIMGGKQALSGFLGDLAQFEVMPCAMGIISWKSNNRKRMIDDFIDECLTAFTTA